eukprot:SAG11_NODE_217_length_12229_cov_9.152185_13_plen_61_part_00
MKYTSDLPYGHDLGSASLAAGSRVLNFQCRRTERCPICIMELAMLEYQGQHNLLSGQRDC